MRILILLIIVFHLFGCASVSTQEKLLRSMAEFDRIYVPALVFVDLQKQRESEIAMQRLMRTWDRFYQKYYGLEIKYGLDITDKFWKADFDKADTLLVSAEAFVGEESLVKAYQKIESVRWIFKQLRERNGWDYFLDGMTEFHGALNQIASTIRGKDKLGDKDLNGLRALFKKAQASWAKVERAEINPDLFGFEAKKVEAIKERIEYEKRILGAFAAALSSKNADRIFQAAQNLRPNFIVLYKAFGDFEPVFNKVKKERQKN